MPEKYRRPHHHERLQAVERMQRAWRDERDALATAQRFNVLSEKGSMVLAQEYSRDHREAPAARYRLRCLRGRGRFGFTHELF